MAEHDVSENHLERWKLLVDDIPYNEDYAIPRYFREHPEIGSPIGPEHTLSNGLTSQSFSGGVVIYDPATGETRMATSED